MMAPVTTTMNEANPATDYDDENDGPQVSAVEVLTWLGEGKGLIALLTAIAIAIAAAFAFLWPPSFTAHTTLLPPGAQQPSGSAAALASLGVLGGLAGGLATKTPEELYVALLRSDTLLRALDERYQLQQRYDYRSFVHLRKRVGKYISVEADKKSGVITLQVTDRDPAFAADLANAHVEEIKKILDRLAVSEAQQRRIFFEQQLQATKDKLIAAEQDLRKVQERSGVIVLDKQAEALIEGAAQLRAQIAEREVQLKVLKTGATERNPDVIRMNSELAALRSELARIESRQGQGNSANPLDMQVARLPEAAIDYIRARRELKLQETLLESMIRQFEIAKLDEAKEGQLLQQIDKAVPPDYRSFPSRLLFLAAGAAAGLLLGIGWVVARRYAALASSEDSADADSWRALGRAWRLRG
ncbi:Wzz/FepE/Etk N-terminal domain-containing protein [Piscinibacter sakaiensis]|uniref:Wzz/FepE/Etk N-terminal domain-containing protein n=1 Tax=Piscinibacter sakaiensis TaxID=1547922 RepID=UPI003AB04FE1